MGYSANMKTRLFPPNTPRFIQACCLSKLVLLLLLAIASSVASARTFKPVGTTQGLEARVVTTMMFDSQGLLWIGSREGLYRFDGYVATAFLPQSGNPGAISDIDIRSVYESRDGSVWVGTNTGGLNRYDRVSGKFENFRRDSSDPGSILDDSVSGISEGPDGELWISTQKGLSRLDRDTGHFEHFLHDAKNPASLSQNWINNLYLSGSGTLWLSTSGGGVNRWNPSSDDFTRYDLARLTAGPPKRNLTLSMYEDNEGILWVGTREGLVRLDPMANEADYVDLGSKDGDLPIVTALQADNASRLWLATRQRGLLVFDRTSGEYYAAGPESSEAVGHLPKDALTSLSVGANYVFIGTWGSGVYRMPLQKYSFELLSMANTQGLTNNVISAVMVSGDNGYPWLGSFGGGPQRVDVGNRVIGVKPVRRHQMRESGVLSMVGPIGGRLYAGTTDGLYEFTDDGSQVALYQNDPARPDGIGEGYVNALLPAAGDTLWLGMGGSGLHLFETDTQRFSTYRHESGRADSISGDFVTTLLEEPGGYLWVGTRSNGLNRCRTENWSCQRFDGRDNASGELSHHHVTSLFRDRRNRVWVGTGGGGLSLVLQDSDGEVTEFRQWRAANGLLNDEIMAIEEDLDESLWLSSNLGLSRLNPTTGYVVNFAAASGLPASHFNASASASDSGNIYFGSTNGLLIIPKGSLLETREPPVVRVISVKSARKGQKPLSVKPSNGQLRVPYAEVISVEMAVLDFSESSHEYAYRLDSAAPWTELGTQRQIIFHGLKPGQYQLKVRGRGVHGLWGESGTLALEIVPPFWMTPWFRGLAVFLLLSLALVVHFARQATLKRRSRELLRLGERREQALEEKLGREAELSVLTPRQKEILQLIAEGNSTREIAELLGVSIKTVEAHRSNLMERLEIFDVPGLVRLAIRSRLISLEN
jgi:ligand-binding sensor domain-containing protein/DNA-binding CsgD family transcriptional regulator